MIYLDYAANSPTLKEVLDTFNEGTIKYFGNPNSSHRLGLEAKQALDEATLKAANILGISKDEIIYTSGASEANNLAIKGICEKYKDKGKHILTTAIEHSSIIAAMNYMQDNGFEVDIIPLLENGLIDIEALKSLLRNDTILVSICAIDSEIGLVEPVEEIGNLLKDYPNCIFHIDASQAIGKIKIDLTNIDLMTISPHKFYGLNGFGALIKKKNIQLIPLIHGGKSVTIYRSGTPDLANVLAMTKALEIAYTNMDKNNNHVKRLNQILRTELSKYDLVHINSPENAIPNTLNFSIRGVNSKDFAKELENFDIFISTKSACSSEENISKAVYAVTRDEDLASSSLRISISYLTNETEIEEFLKYFDICYKKL